MIPENNALTDEKIQLRIFRNVLQRPDYILVDDIDDDELVLKNRCIETLNFQKEFDRAYDVALNYANELKKSINDLFEKNVRENSYPPIKGEITKGKLKWRGIKLCQKNTANVMEQWIEQRGVLIGSPVVIDFSTLYPKREP